MLSDSDTSSYEVKSSSLVLGLSLDTLTVINVIITLAVQNVMFLHSTFDHLQNTHFVEG